MIACEPGQISLANDSD
jgi:hypothetical protein